MPAHHQIEETIDEYLARVSIEDNQPLFLSKTPFTCTPWTPIVTRSPLSAATCLISPHVPAGLGPAAKYPRASAKLKIGDAGGSANTKSPLAGAFETAQ